MLPEQCLESAFLVPFYFQPFHLALPAPFRSFAPRSLPPPTPFFCQGSAAGPASPAGMDDGGDSDDSAAVSADEMDAGAMEDDDDDDFSHRRGRGGSGASGAGSSSNNTKGGGGAGSGGRSSPVTRSLRGSARTGGGSGSVAGWSVSSDAPPPEPVVVDSEFRAATCHRQVGLVLQKGKTLRAGCRFALRVAKTPEDLQAMAEERAETGVEWAKYEMPGDDLELDLEAYPGLVLPPPPQNAAAAGDGDLLPGVTGAAPPAAGSTEGPQGKEGSGGAASRDGDADEDGDLSNLYVALQGWVRHDVNDAEVRLRPRGAGTGAAGAVVVSGATTGGAEAASEGGAAAVAVGDDTTNLAAAAVAAADAAAAANKLQAAAAPLPVLEDEVTEALKREQEKLRETTRRNRETIDAKLAVLNPMVQEASNFA